MRLWSLHPRLLDRQGLLAVWREGLLAQKVLAGKTRGYRHHPQLQRFRSQPDPLMAIGAYLATVAEEAESRGYRFAVGKILCPGPAPAIPVTAGQLDYEWRHLGRKLQQRDNGRWQAQADSAPQLHPLFIAVPGDVEAWEVLP
ncbi:MAG: pyrimidine dimer DNA glycosylase/endonuclease V [Desulfuromonadales bacterium]|nr:pyrimidine dimer DNA glycosylase/endonuclease V [Desulfuromonadales bacterium]